MRTLLRRTVAVLASPPILVLGLAVAQAQRGYAQTQSQPDASMQLAAGHEPSPGGPDANVSGASVSGTAVAPDPEIVKRFAAMEARIEQLESQLKARGTAESAPSPAVTAVKAIDTTAAAAQAEAAKPQGPPPPAEPFAYADWTWLNGNAAQQGSGVGFEVLHP